MEGENMEAVSTIRVLAKVSMVVFLFNACAFVVNGASMALAQDRPVRIVALGDSLTAGFGLPPGDALPSQLEAALKRKGYRVEVENAGVSGDTTAAALQRLDWAVPGPVDAVIVALGANDALRGIDPSQTRRNLDEILTRLKSKGAAVLLAGMRAPRNWGDDYVRRFDPIFAELAAKHGALLMPFLLENVALRPELNLEDGLHPNRKGVAVIVETMMPQVEQLIARVKAKRQAAAN